MMVRKKANKHTIYDHFLLNGSVII